MDPTQRPTVVPDPRGWTPQQEGGHAKPGTRLGGRFVLLDHLGAGGGAVVARARDEQLRTIVAVKLLRSRDPDLQRRFAREAEVLANIQHPSIVRVLAHGRDADELYMALELIDGPNLAQQLAGSGPLPWRKVLEIGLQIADALDTVHGKGLIHRDVKPANIMLADGGEHPHVKLIDFGYARLTEDYRDPTGFTPDPRRRTDLGLAIGTPGYLPIEAGLAPADERFDIYGLGVTLYELLTGELPGIEPLRPLREVNPSCDAPEDLGLVLAAALALEPGDRTQSAAELGRALEAIRTAHPEPSRPSARLDGRYELLSVLGIGAKGDVYLANHRGCGHDVALKFLRSTHPDDVRRFEREAKLLALLNAPGLPRFFDYAPLAERPYIAMACAPGVPAVRFCLASDKIRLRPVEVIEVGRQLAQVLALLHERGVLHRDINANNVMIELGRTPRVTLIDFGCAALGASFYTHASLRYRTPPEARVEIPDGGIEQLAWSAPEVRAGAGWSDKSDVYALGWLLYRLITGKLPTRPDSDEPVPVHKVAPTCPADLARVVLQTLQPRPGDRPSAAQLITAFQDLLEDEAPIEQIDEPAARHAPPPASPTLALPPAASSLAPRTLHRSAGVLLAAVAALCVWWAGRATAPSASDPVSATPTTVSAIPITTEIDAHPGSLPTATAPPPISRPVLPAMRAALDAVAPQLRACGSGAGLFIEFTIADGRDQFAGITVIGDHEEHVDRCVRAAVAELRFAPTTAQIVHEAYTP